MKDKLKVIDQLLTKHPSNGIEKGWGKYVRGMTDTSEWFVRIMLDQPVEELQALLDKIIADENKPEPILTEQELADQKIIIQVGNSFTTEYTRKQMEKFTNEGEQKILFGS